jgi:hypothetical protein
MAAMLLPRSKAKDEKAAKSATAAATICDLCDVYTQNGLEGKWSELLKVYDVRSPCDFLVFFSVSSLIFQVLICFFPSLSMRAATAQ